MVNETNCDFSGWATRNDLKCSDGRTIRKDAFKHNDGMIVPLVWNHQHDDINDVLGHAMLENHEDGVYAYGKFNETESGQAAKQLVEHGDVKALSIYANQLKQNGGDVLHGAIREVSLVLAGANPGAFIDSIIVHGEESEEEAIIYTGEDICLRHSAAEDQEDDLSNANKKKEAPKKADETVDGEKTVADVFNTLTEEQKNVVYAMIGMAIGNAGADEKEGENDMKHNAFETDAQTTENVLSHSEMDTIIGDAKRYGSLRDSFMAHSEEYGIENVDYLFPDAKSLTAQPEFIKRDTTWVSKVISETHHTPFSRIKSLFADITEDEARARGYIKGNLKKEEVFSLLKRTTTPTTIFIKQKMDRDDMVDITDFDVIAWLKTEMRTMLDEEIARSILVGDGRLASSDDKINESNIRPIWKDDDLYSVKAKISYASADTDDAKAKKAIKGIIKNRKEYKGSGNPTFFTTEDFVTDCLLIEDSTGRRIYNTISDLATALRVKEIITVEIMENLSRTSGTDTLNLIGIMVNLADYNVGADKGGSINMFDDFDIDYNQQKYLIETRCSGALTKPYSALVVESVTA